MKALGDGDKVTYKTGASAKAGAVDASADSSVSVRKDDKGKYHVETSQETANKVGLRTQQEPPATSPAASLGRTSPEERQGQPRGPTVDTAPGSERTGGLSTKPGGVGILTPGGVGVLAPPGQHSTTTQGGVSNGPALDGPVIGRTTTPAPQSGQLGKPNLFPGNAQSPVPETPKVEVGPKTGSMVRYTFDTADEAARAAEVLQAPTVAKKDEAAAIDAHLSAQEWSYGATATADAGGGVTGGQSGTAAYGVEYDHGRVSAATVKTTFDVNAEIKVDGIGLSAGDKITFASTTKDGQTTPWALLSVGEQAKGTDGPISNSGVGARTDYRLSDKGLEVSGFVTTEQAAKIPAALAEVRAAVIYEDRILHQLPGA